MRIFDCDGDFIIARFLLDTASQISICTKELANKLNLNTYRKQLQISGISHVDMVSDEMINLKLHSTKDQNDSVDICCAVLEKITCKLPHTNINISDLKIPKNVSLADPNFNISSQIDLLLGADVYYELLVPGVIKLGKDLPMLVNTILGYIVGGKYSNDNNYPSKNRSLVNCNKVIRTSSNEELIPNASLLTYTSSNETDELIKKFWTLEEIDTKNILSPDDEKSEKIFNDTTV